ncbi:MAG: hypothetical protein LBE91_09190 [Tannerella sp.]|jgi:hypothetical protein|nr:hypothetical protein [Tannerella sp.]
MKPIQIYKPTATAGVIFGVAFFMTLIVMAFMLYVAFFKISKADAEDKSMLTITFSVLTVLLLFFGFLIRKHRKKTKFYLYENGVKIGKNGNMISFENIQDIFLFLTGRYIGNGYNNLAFRTSENDEWNLIPATYSGNINVFLDRYYAPRVRFLENEMQRGNAAKFLRKTKNSTIISTARAFIKNQQTETIRLDEHSIFIGNQTFDYAGLLPLYMNGEKFEVKTVDNKLIASLHYVDVMSFDVFREIYNHKTKK